MFANDFAQATPDTIARHCRPECSRGDKSGSKRNRLVCFEHAEQDQDAALDLAVLLYPLKFG